jgi:magnesium-transporting ATPase (P-type)
MKIESAIEHFSKSNQKIVMVAYKEVNGIPSKWSHVEKDLVLIAMIGIKDFIRSGVKKTIKECENLGINVRMLSN